LHLICYATVFYVLFSAVVGIQWVTAFYELLCNITQNVIK